MNKQIRNVFSLILATAMLLGLIIAPAGAVDEEKTEIKNIIVMIPDGGGFGNFDMAEAVKKAGVGVEGTRTQVTTNAIAGKTCDGLYLSDYLVGTSKTDSLLMTESQYGPGATDSAAGGTAIATGHKTNNSMVSRKPIGGKTGGMAYASIMEACQMKGKSTGIVTTSYYYDATPASFGSHAMERGDFDDIIPQLFNHNFNIIMGGAPEGNSDCAINPSELGYTIVSNKAELEESVNSKNTKICGFFGDDDEPSMDYDDEPSDEPTFLDMTKASIKTLSENIDNENGFCLMLEGGQVDHGAHEEVVLDAVTEYLAFDEAFAYAVNWAMNDGHTVVVAVPDHDTGGLNAVDEAAAVADLQKAIEPDETKISWGRSGSHTPQNVGIWLYAPDDVKVDILEGMGLPTTGAPEAVRSGKYYSGVKFNEEYAIENSSIMHGVAKTVGIDLDEATEKLFVDIASQEIGKYDVATSTFTTEDGIQIHNHSNYYIKPDGTKVNFEYGISFYNGIRRTFCVPDNIAKMLTEPEWTNPFIDVKEGEWFYDAVKYVNSTIVTSADGDATPLMRGNNSDETFEPMTSMSRAMLATAIWRLEGCPAPKETSKFSDLTDNWYKDAVAWAAENEIVKGTGETTFEPYLVLSREMIATMLFRYAEYKEADVSARDELKTFPDGGDVSDWGLEGMKWAVASKIIGGKGEGDSTILAAKVTSNRAEVAKMLMNYNNALSK